MKKLLLAAIAAAVVLAGTVQYAAYQVAHQSYVTQLTSKEQLTKSLQDLQTSKLTTALILVTSGDKEMEAMFKASAKKYHGKILFLEVDPSKVQEASVGEDPAVVVVDKVVGLQVLRGKAPSQQALDNVIEQLLAINGQFQRK